MPGLQWGRPGQGSNRFKDAGGCLPGYLGSAGSTPAPGDRLATRIQRNAGGVSGCRWNYKTVNLQVAGSSPARREAVAQPVEQEFHHSCRSRRRQQYRLASDANASGPTRVAGSSPARRKAVAQSVEQPVHPIRRGRTATHMAAGHPPVAPVCGECRWNYTGPSLEVGFESHCHLALRPGVQSVPPLSSPRFFIAGSARLQQ